MAPRRALAGLLAAPALVLGGCGGDSSVADPPVHSAPHSVATSDPPAHETAEHFIRRWAEAEKQMENTGVTKPYLALTSRCHACITLAHLVSRYYANGGFIRWDGWKILTIKKYPSPRSGISFAVQSSSSPTHYKASADAKVKRLAGGQITYVLTLNSDGPTFLVTSKAQLSR